jgi:hypothetical protein
MMLIPLVETVVTQSLEGEDEGEGTSFETKLLPPPLHPLPPNPGEGNIQGT